MSAALFEHFICMFLGETVFVFFSIFCYIEIERDIYASHNNIPKYIKKEKRRASLYIASSFLVPFCMEIWYVFLCTKCEDQFFILNQGTFSIEFLNTLIIILIYGLPFWLFYYFWLIIFKFFK